MNPRNFTEGQPCVFAVVLSGCKATFINDFRLEILVGVPKLIGLGGQLKGALAGFLEPLQDGTMEFVLFLECGVVHNRPPTI